MILRGSWLPKFPNVFKIYKIKSLTFCWKRDKVKFVRLEHFNLTATAAMAGRTQLVEGAHLTDGNTSFCCKSIKQMLQLRAFWGWNHQIRPMNQLWHDFTLVLCSFGFQGPALALEAGEPVLADFSLPVVSSYLLWRVREGWQDVCFGQQLERWILRVLAFCSILVIGGNSPSASRSWLFGAYPNRLFEDPASTLPEPY